MSNYLEIVFTSAVVATLTGTVVTHYFDFYKQKRSSKLDALGLAVELEGYVLECADKLSGHDTAISSRDCAGCRLLAIPTFPVLSASPVEAGLFWFKTPKLANRILALPQEYKISLQSSSFWWEVVGDRDCADSAIVLETAKLASLALELANDIRKEFSLPERTLVFGDYDVQKVINKFNEK